jgi:hypothetical protein
MFGLQYRKMGERERLEIYSEFRMYDFAFAKFFFDRLCNKHNKI